MICLKFLIILTNVKSKDEFKLFIMADVQDYSRCSLGIHAVCRKHLRADCESDVQRQEYLHRECSGNAEKQVWFFIRHENRRSGPFQEGHRKCYERDSRSGSSQNLRSNPGCSRGEEQRCLHFCCSENHQDLHSTNCFRNSAGCQQSACYRSCNPYRKKCRNHDR